MSNTGYVSSSNSNYTVYLSKNGNYTVCVRVTDKVGNSAIISNNIELERRTTLPYGKADLSLNDGIFTLILSDYGDEGGDLLNTFGFALISSGNCETATYEYQSELSKTYSDNYIEGTTYYGCIKLEDNDGNIVYINSSGIEYLYNTGIQTYTTSGEYEFVISSSSTYEIELWGAQGGGTSTYSYGGYTSGKIYLPKGENIYVYVGQTGTKSTDYSFNGGGGSGIGYWDGSYLCNSGGGATDIRFKNGNWDDIDSLVSRIMVAGGGGGRDCYNGSNGTTTTMLGYGGGLIGSNGSWGRYDGRFSTNIQGYGGTQISGGKSNNGAIVASFGKGAPGVSPGTANNQIAGSGGGGGYYGGGGGLYGDHASSGGGGAGSSYISGHTGCVAIESSTSIEPRTGIDGTSCDTGTNDNLCSIHYSGRKFTDTVMIDGAGYAWSNTKGSLLQMPNPNGGYYASGVGHSGDGAARITWDFVVDSSTLALTYDNQGGSGCYSKSVTSGSTYGELCVPVRDEYIFDGWYTAVSGGTEIMASTTVSETVDHTIYAHWTEATNPVITFSNIGNSEYVSGNISSIITVSKGSSDLDYNSFKYIYSTNIDDTPNIAFKSENSYTLENATGIYYLIAQACDINGNCTTEVSNPFYVDNSPPTGNLIVSTGKSSINIEVNASDQDSGIDTYEYLATLDGSCPTIGYVSSSNSSYTVYLPTSGNYTSCVRITDKLGNSIILSENVEFETKTTLPYGRADLSLTDRTFTLSLSDYGDEGGDLLNTFGFSLISNGGCESAKYEYQTEPSKTYSENLNNNVIYYGCIKLEDRVGNINYIKSSEIEYLYISGTQTYTTSGEYEFTVPSTGTYKLEVWGAQGGNSTSYSGARGGYGGYSVGNIYLSKNDILYINVGGKGVDGNNSSSTKAGGYNGGGDKITPDSSYYSSSGGGATHVATVSGELSTLSSYAGNNDSPILIVAGGGGGGAGNSGNYGAGGDGGGIAGMRGTNVNGNTGWGAGGTQTKAGCQNTSTTSLCGTFGKGNSTSSGHGGAGGGGYYGGGGTNSGNIGGGGGGSGYIGKNLLTDKYMYCYNCTTSDVVSTKTYTTTNVSDTPTSDYAKSGDGAARITWSAVIEQSTLTLTYDNQGGSGCYSKSVTSGSTYGELCTPVKDGYIFNGWYTEVSGGTEITSSTTVSETVDHTIYAHWTEATNPVITFSNNGNSGYVSGNISSIITVSKGSNDLDSTTFKYIYSTNIDDTPNIDFKNENSYTLENATGIYYLIAQACDINGNCTTEVSNPFYVDNTKPIGNIAKMEQNGSTLSIFVNASDNNSGVKEYGYLIQTDSTCPTVGYMTSTNGTYNFIISAEDIYYVCVKIVDNAGNVEYISKSMHLTLVIDYQSLSNSYSCANASLGTNHLFTYTGNCEIVDDGNGNWNINFLTDGVLTVSQNINIDAFLVGAGGSGISNAGGGGGYNNTLINYKLSSGNEYQITIGQGATSSDGGATSAFGASANGGGKASSTSAYYPDGDWCSDSYYYYYGGAGGSGGGVEASGGIDGANGSAKSDSVDTSTCNYRHYVYRGGAGSGKSTRAFGETTTTLYSSGGGTNINGGENTGNGGYGDNPGGSGIVVIRNSREGIKINYSYSCKNMFNGSEPFAIAYTGVCDVFDEENGDWKIKFLTSGTLTVSEDINIDAFLVGAGGSGEGGAGGGGGYVNTVINHKLSSGNEYSITIGQGAKDSNGGTTSAFDYTASGGKKASYSFSLGWENNGCSGGDGYYSGGAGGSGGGANGKGGTDGASGVSGPNTSHVDSCTNNLYHYSGGAGSGKTTREFGEADGELYSSGGGTNINGGDNTGNGSYTDNKPGGSGIVVIRNSREGIKINYSYSCKNMFNGTEPFAITYTGVCDVFDEGNNNWKIKFLTSGTLTVTEDINIDAFLVGAGGSGISYAGGGGGYVKTITNYLISSGNEYSITVGQGAKDSAGGTTSAFESTVNGGSKGYRRYDLAWENNGCAGGTGYYYAGSGGSGGGANGDGGIDGSNGVTGPDRSQVDSCTNDRYYHYGGTGSGSTTREFGEADGELYSSGGGTNINGGDNTGNGGHNGNAGGSGVVIIRDAR